MDRPRYAELCALLDLVAEIEAAMLTERDELAAVMRGGLERLVGCDNSLCTAVDTDTVAQTTTATDAALVAPRLRDRSVWLECLRQLPTAYYWEHGGTDPALRLSDLVSARSYRRLPLYQYFFRPFGVEHKLDTRIHLSPSRWIDVGLIRERRDFSERERTLLAQLHPYAQRLLRRAEASPLTTSLRRAFGLTHREAELLALLTRGKTNLEIAATLIVSPTTVRTHLEHIYAKLGVRNRTEATIRALAHARSTAPSSDAVHPDRSLPSEILRATATTTADPQSPPLAAFGLTQREHEVLALVAQGRRNPEIADTLSIAPATVKRHLERIYSKLGVQRRTHAATRALSFATGANSP